MPAAWASTAAGSTSATTPNSALADPTVNPAGTLRYTANADDGPDVQTQSAARWKPPAGVTLTLNGAAVNGGFLRGPGTFAVTGGTVLSGVTTAISTTVIKSDRGRPHS